MDRFKLRALRKRLDEQFAETYKDAMSGGSSAAMSFISLSKARVTVQNGRRIQHEEMPK